MANWNVGPFLRLAGGALLSVVVIDGASERRVFAPVFVGRPPADAVMGLTRLPNGEIRYYNYNEHADSEDPLYMVSFDNGFTWQRQQLTRGSLAADVRSPVSGEYMRVSRGQVIRSRGGIDGTWEVRRIEAESCGGPRPVVFIRGGKRVLFACSSRQMSGTLYSDDDGLSWRRSNLVGAPPHRPGGVHQSARWQNGAVEPTLVELNDGRIWMLMRTSQDTLYESYSSDGGETWQEARPSRFYSTLTMPTLGRLRDSRILLLWNNTTPLPEVARDASHKFFVGWGAIDGSWEDVFTNRDALHAAISSDGGKTWQGFRELFLNERRNDFDYAVAGMTTQHDDRSVHQNQFVELDDGSVLVALGQHWMQRALVKFHPDWLLEKTRSSSFENGLTDWSVHMYIAGIRGHCAFNRKMGASLVEHPDRSGKRVLHVRRPKDPSVVSENQGAVWNFPAGSAGVLTVRMMFQKGGQGGRITLLDRWVNPTDLVVDEYAMYTVRVSGDGKTDSGIKLEPGRWHEMRFEWDGLLDRDKDQCRVSIDGVLQKARLPLRHASPNGISYVHFLSSAESEDNAGFLVESVATEVR